MVDFTQRRKDRKDAKARSMHLTRLCVFAIFASLREKLSSYLHLERDAGARVEIDQLPRLQQTRIFNTIRGGNVLPVVAFPLAVGHALHGLSLRRGRQRSRARRLCCAWSICLPERELRDLLLRQIDR